MFQLKNRNEDENLIKSTFTALKEARETIYINGRWIWANDQFLYTIVKSRLHSNEDYSSFCKSNLKSLKTSLTLLKCLK